MTDLHDLLEAIRSEDVHIATDALFHLSVRVCTQGVAVNSDTAPALPAIIDIVASNGSRIRNELLRLIIKISRASHAWRKAAHNAGPDYFRNYSEKIEWEIAVERVLDDAAPIFARLATGEDPGMAAMARDLVERHHKT